MTSSNESSFPLQGALDVEYHVTLDLLESWWYLTILRKLKGDHHILHFFGNGLFPEVCSSLPVNSQCLLNRVRELNAEFVSPLPVAGLHLLDDSVSLPEDTADPPFEAWHLVQVMGYCILSYLHWVGDLQVLERNPSG